MNNKTKYYLLLFALLIIMAIALFFFRGFLNENSNSLLVLITFVYVVATVEICRANIESAEASREQLAESKRQYEDKRRLEVLPYIQFEKTKDAPDHELNLMLDSSGLPTQTSDLLLRMKNVGNGTAKEIMYTYLWDNLKLSYDRGLFPVQALSSGESQIIKLRFAYSSAEIDVREARFSLRYKDLLENMYSQQLSIKIKWNSIIPGSSIEFSTSPPVLESSEQKQRETSLQVNNLSKNGTAEHHEQYD